MKTRALFLLVLFLIGLGSIAHAQLGKWFFAPEIGLVGARQSAPLKTEFFSGDDPVVERRFFADGSHRYPFYGLNVCYRTQGTVSLRGGVYAVTYNNRDFKGEYDEHWSKGVRYDIPLERRRAQRWVWADMLIFFRSKERKPESPFYELGFGVSWQRIRQEYRFKQTYFALEEDPVLEGVIQRTKYDWGFPLAARAVFPIGFRAELGFNLQIVSLFEGGDARKSLAISYAYRFNR